MQRPIYHVLTTLPLAGVYRGAIVPGRVGAFRSPPFSLLCTYRSQIFVQDNHTTTIHCYDVEGEAKALLRRRGVWGDELRRVACGGILPDQLRRLAPGL